MGSWERELEGRTLRSPASRPRPDNLTTSHIVSVKTASNAVKFVATLVKPKTKKRSQAGLTPACKGGPTSHKKKKLKFRTRKSRCLPQQLSTDSPWSAVSSSGS